MARPSEDAIRRWQEGWGTNPTRSAPPANPAPAAPLLTVRAPRPFEPKPPEPAPIADEMQDPARIEVRQQKQRLSRERFTNPTPRETGINL